MKDFLVLRVVSKFIIPYLLVFGFYILLNGKSSVGGGFQAGVLLASTFILYTLVWGKARLLKVVTLNELICCASLGLFLFIAVGLTSLLFNQNFLNYSALLHDSVSGQQLGIFLVETAIGLSVFAIILLIFVAFISKNFPLSKGDN